MTTYTVTLTLDAKNEPALRAHLTQALGSTVAMLARVEKAGETFSTRARWTLRFTETDVERMLEAVEFMLADELDAETEEEADQKREELERASAKLRARLNAVVEARRRRTGKGDQR